MLTVPETLLACLAFTGCLLLIRFERQLRRAENACEELRKQVMRGATVARLPRKSTNARADLLVDVVAIDGEYHAFTNSPLPTARRLYKHLVTTQQIHPLPPIQK